jgi:hypothetical protein
VTFFNAFALSFGLLLAGTALIAGWIFRTAAAPLTAKLVLPALLVVLGCLTPYEVNSMLGLPKMVTPDALPDRAELVAFVSLDQDSRADLWLRVEDAPPRAYEIAIDEKMKELLRDARDRKERGGRVVLIKRTDRPDKETGRQGVSKQQYSDPAFAIDESAFALPSKGSGASAAN